jgi:hypothetical protein
MSRARFGHNVSSIVRQGKSHRATRVSEKKKILAFAGRASGHSRSPGVYLAAKPGHDGGLELLVCTPHFGNLHSSCGQLLVGDSAYQRVLSPASADVQLADLMSTQALLLLRLRTTAKSRLLAGRVRTSGQLSQVRSAPVDNKPLTQSHTHQ